MRLVSFHPPEGPLQAGVLHGDDTVVPAGPALAWADVVSSRAPVDMVTVLERWAKAEPVLRAAAEEPATQTVPRDLVELGPPVPQPRSLRDFYAFEEHVARSWKRRGADVPEAWYEVPVFYFSNPNSVIGPGDGVRPPRATEALDYELEVAWVTGRPLRDPSPDEAWDAVVGLTIMNDWSARDIQKHEMSVGLGPAKGKDFATSLGPCILTVDELDDVRTDTGYDLAMTATVNGEELSSGNLSELYHSIGAMTARAAADATLHPGDVLGTGTVGTGSLLDLGRAFGDYLQTGDEVVLDVERIGTLTNRVEGPTEA